MLSANGQLLCNTTSAPTIPALAAPFPERVDGRMIDNLSLWLVPIASANGTRYEYLWLQPPTNKAPPQRG